MRPRFSRPYILEFERPYVLYPPGLSTEFVIWFELGSELRLGQVLQQVYSVLSHYI